MPNHSLKEYLTISYQNIILQKISRCDGVLLEDGKPFRFASFNISGLLLTEDRNTFDSWVPPTPEEQEDAILTVKGAHGRVIRTYTLGFGETHHMFSNGLFYEPAWIAMDYALSLARNIEFVSLYPSLTIFLKEIKAAQKILVIIGPYVTIEGCRLLPFTRLPFCGKT